MEDAILSAKGEAAHRGQKRMREHAESNQRSWKATRIRRLREHVEDHLSGQIEEIGNKLIEKWQGKIGSELPWTYQNTPEKTAGKDADEQLETTLQDQFKELKKH